MKNMIKKRLERPDWKDYELQILKIYRVKYPTRFVFGDLKIKGRFSKRARQLDVVVYKKNGQEIDTVIECKQLSKVVTIPVLDSFYGKLHDLGISKGVIITTNGFSASTKEYAQKKKIKLIKIEYEYLKDYYYIPPSYVPEVFIKATRYSSPYCSKCNITCLYEIGEVYGMAEHEALYCPKCKMKLTEVRSDANHRVIKLFKGDFRNETEIEKTIAKHINITREEWITKKYLVDFSNQMADRCFICEYEFGEYSLARIKSEYKGKAICTECLNSRRTLLIDYNYL